MDGLQQRVDSFAKGKRVKNPKKPNSYITLKWPHSINFKANPETLAEAGFFYNPSHDDPDNVTCYVCEKELGGWEEHDDPFVIHWSKCADTCCWANVRCGLVLDLDHRGSFISAYPARIPSSKAMEKARLETFSAGSGWIHDKKKNHGACSKMMARAGFVYTPLHSGDDLVTCLYCQTSLSGWVSEDDPLEEHRKRQDEAGACPFFAQSNEDAREKPPSRSQASKPPSKTQTKPPSRSTSRSKFQEVIMPTKTDDGPSEVAQSTSAKTDAKTPRKPRSTSGTRKSSAKTPRAKSRSTSRSAVKNVTEDQENGEPQSPPPTIKKKGRTRSKSVVRSEHEHEHEEVDNATETATRSRPKREPAEDDHGPGTSKRSRSKSKALPSEEPQEESKPKASKTRQKKVAAPNGDEKASTVPAKKTTRTTSRTKAKPQTDASDPDSDEQPPPSQPSRKQTVKSTKQLHPVENLFDDDIVMDEHIPPPSSPGAAKPTEMSPLLIPKRTAKKPEENNQQVPIEKKKPGRSKGKPKKPPPRDSPSPEAISRANSPVEENDIFSYSERQPPVLDILQPLAKKQVSDQAKTPPTNSTMSQAHLTSVAGIISDDEPEVDEESSAVEVQHLSEKPPSRISASKQQTPDEEITSQIDASPHSMGPGLEDHDDHMSGAGEIVETQPSVDPSTPPRPQINPSPPTLKTRQETEIITSSGTDLAIPALSKLPFTPLQSLAEAEQDMTVEEWIRYQMEVEFDKFRRDGERELQRFRKRAEEVRQVIEGL